MHGSTCNMLYYGCRSLTSIGFHVHTLLKVIVLVRVYIPAQNYHDQETSWVGKGLFGKDTTISCNLILSEDRKQCRNFNLVQ